MEGDSPGIRVTWFKSLDCRPPEVGSAGIDAPEFGVSKISYSLPAHAQSVQVQRYADTCGAHITMCTASHTVVRGSRQCFNGCAKAFEAECHGTAVS